MLLNPVISQVSSGSLGLGTAAFYNVPTVGNASSSQVVLGSDTRLTDSVGSSGLANPMTTAGDLITATASGVATRLGIGSTNQVLAVSSSGTAIWQNSTGASNIIYASSVAVPDCNVRAGTKIGGGTPTNNLIALNNALLAATATTPFKLIVDGGFAASGGLLIPNTANTVIEGIGDAGFFVMSGGNSDIIKSASVGSTNAANLRAWTPIGTEAVSGYGVTLKNLYLNGNRGTYPTGNCNGMIDGTVSSPSPSPDARGLYTSSYLFTGINLHGQERVLIDNVYLYDIPTFGMSLYHCHNVNITNCSIYSPSRKNNTDGIHLNGGCSDINISGCYFATGDDAIAYNVEEGDNTSGKRLVINNCRFDDCNSGLRVYGNLINTAKIVVSNIVGDFRYVFLVYGLEIAGSKPLGIDESVRISNSDITMTQVGSTVVWVNSSGNSIDLDGVVITEPPQNHPIFLWGENATLDSASVDIEVIRNANGSSLVNLLTMSQGTLTNLKIKNWSIKDQTGTAYSSIPYLLNLTSSATVTNIWIDSLDPSHVSAFTNDFTKIGTIGGPGVLNSGFAFPDANIANNTVYISSTKGGATCLKLNGSSYFLSLSVSSSGSSGLINPMTTLGDLVIGAGGGAPNRLPVGTAGQVLTVNNGSPAWEIPLVNVVSTLPTATLANRGALYLLEGQPPYDPEILSDSPTHYYPLNNTVGATGIVDLGSGNINSTSITSVTFGVAGGCIDGSTAAQFDNITNHGITFSGSGLLNDVTNSFSVEFGFYLASSAGGAFYAQVSSGTWLQLYYNAGNFKIYNGSSIDTGYSPTTGSWKHSVFTYSSVAGAWYWYVNGSVAASATIGAFTNYSGTVTSYIGDGGGGSPINGDMQKFATYNVCLSPSQVSNHYNAWSLAPSSDTLYIDEQTATDTYVLNQVATLPITNAQVSGLGTAATYNVPVTGNATSGQVVLGSDTRLFANPMTTTGDTVYETGGVATRLPIGSTSQVLTVVGGVPAWTTSTGGSSGFTNPMTTLGDIITGAASGVAQRLGIGSETQVLTVSGGTPTWATPSTSESGGFSPCYGYSQAVSGTVCPDGAFTVIQLGSNSVVGGTAIVQGLGQTGGAGIKPGTAGTYLITATTGFVVNVFGYGDAGYGINGTKKAAIGYSGQSAGQTSGSAIGIVTLLNTDVVNLVGQSNSAGDAVWPGFCSLTVVRIA